jgi:uncharacterized protein HemX
MNRDRMTVLLAAALLISAVATAGVCFWYLQNVRQHALAQEDLARINRNKNLMQNLAAESVEYAKKNPAMIPLLQSLGVRARMETNSPATQAGER